jgi:hypothetical protein
MPFHTDINDDPPGVNDINASDFFFSFASYYLTGAQTILG